MSLLSKCRTLETYCINLEKLSKKGDHKKAEDLLDKTISEIRKMSIDLIKH